MNKGTLMLTTAVVITGVINMMCDGMWLGYFGNRDDGAGYKNIPHKAKNRYGNRKRTKRR